MEEYKARFIEFLLSKEALKISEPSKTHSGRMSPYFLNTGKFNDGESISALGEFYAKEILRSVGTNFDTLMGPPYKGISISQAAAEALARAGYNKGFTSYRKERKLHGEGTQTEGKKQLHIELIVNYPINDNSKVLLVDDVFTTGDTKYQAFETINAVADNVHVPALIIAVDRQEIDEDGENAIQQFTNKTEIDVRAIVTVSEIYKYMDETGRLSYHDRNEFMRYLQAWGTQEVRDEFGLAVSDLIKGDRTFIPACDVPLERFEELVKATHDMRKIGGYKIPAAAGRKGWERWVEVARNYTNKPLIYDHQKGGTDIPDTAHHFMHELKKAGFDAVILFPMAGPRTQVAWTGEAIQNDLTVLIGGEMTHEKYKRSEGGYIDDDALEEIYLRAAKQGVRHFVVPGNKTERIKFYKELIENKVADPVFFSPGFVLQGGKISDTAATAGDKWHAIVGREIYNAADIRKAAEELAQQL